MRSATEYSQESVFPSDRLETRKASLRNLFKELSAFDRFGTKTRIGTVGEGAGSIPLFLNEFWTSRQRAANSLHEISYRACFKPQLPAYFIERLSEHGDVVYDPFSGRGTTASARMTAGYVRRGLSPDAGVSWMLLSATASIDAAIA